MKLGANLHVYPAPIVDASRIFRQTAAISESGIFDEIIICGQNSLGLEPVEELDSRRRIERVGRLIGRRPRLAIGRIIEQLRWSLSVYHAWSNRPVRIVNAHSVAVLPICAAIARRHRAGLIYDTHELETETSTSQGIQRRLFKFIERKYIHRCKVVFVVNESIAQWYREEYPGLRVQVVYNAPNRPTFGESVDLRHTFQIDPTNRLYVHVGNIVAHRYVDRILKAFSQRVSGEDHIVFLGSGPLEGLVQDYAERFHNIHYQPSVPATAVVGALATCDVGLCLIEPTCLSYALSLPNKALEYSRAGIPFLYTDLVEVDRLVGEALAGWKVGTTVESLVVALDGVDDAKVGAAKMKLSSIEMPEWGQEAERMLSEYRRVIDAL